MLPTPSSDVIFKSLSEGAVLFHSRTEVYFGLNPVGALIWKLLPPACGSLDELCTRVRQKYPEADPAVVRQDVTELLGMLEELGLVHTLTRAPADDARLDSPAA